MDGKGKIYEMPEAEPMIAAEPVAAYMGGHQATPLSPVCDVRSDVERAITGDMLLSRLRPRIKTLFE